MRALLCLFLAGSLGAFASDKAALIRPLRYTGMADASAAVPVSSNLFVAADDENNTLRLYRADQSGPPIKEFDFNAFLEVRGKSLEADLEGAARLGDRAFWIGSHGRNKNGKERDNRCRLFATDIHVTGEDVTLVPVGRPYKRLLDDLSSDLRFDRFHLAEAARHAPKDREALNIEGLSATPDGHLLLGFRNPIPDGKALLIPLLNPNEVVEERSGRFGPAIQLDLGGLGIRDMAFYQGTYVIIAGPYHGGGPFHLYRWAGEGTRPDRIKTEDFGSLHPEAIIIYAQTGLNEFQLLSDDGTRDTDGISNRDQPMSRRSFRSIWVRP
ncbi:MAG TPA: DUF3616 domain-containing protein [Candidatus Acidoferrum sp.]|jgi:hypothetical protein|nr:DUF3616 domain-containing protein [Candidatus Acidoferrum sp.]